MMVPVRPYPPLQCTTARRFWLNAVAIVDMMICSVVGSGVVVSRMGYWTYRIVLLGGGVCQSNDVFGVGEREDLREGSTGLNRGLRPGETLMDLGRLRGVKLSAVIRTTLQPLSRATISNALK